MDCTGGAALAFAAGSAAATAEVCGLGAGLGASASSPLGSVPKVDPCRGRPAPLTGLPRPMYCPLYSGLA